MSFFSVAANVVLPAIVLLLDTAIDKVHAADVVPANCSTLTTMPDFNLSGILGDWYQDLANRNVYVPNANYSCISESFKKEDDGVVKSYRKIILGKSASIVVNNVTQPYVDEPGKLNYTNNDNKNYPYVMYILDTDYSGYLIKVYCVERALYFNVHILSRDKIISEAASDKVHKALKSQGVPDDLIVIDQGSKCDI